MRLLALIASVLIGLSPAYGDIELLPERTFKALIVCAHAIDCNRAEKTFYMGAAYISEVLPVTFRTVGVVSIPEEMTGSGEERFMKWKERTDGLAMALGADVTYVAVGAFPLMTDVIDGSAEGIFGITWKGTLGLLPVSTFYTKLAGSDKFNAKIVAHELAHTLGADHFNHGIMGWSTDITQVSDSFAPESVQEMRDFLSSL